MSSDWSYLDSPRVESVPSVLSDRISKVEDDSTDFVHVAPLSVRSWHSSELSSPPRVRDTSFDEEDSQSDHFSWNSSPKSHFEDDSFVKDENGLPDSSFQNTFKFNTVKSWSQRHTAVVNGKKVLKFQRSQPRSRRDYFRRRRHLSRLATVSEAAKEAKKEAQEAQELSLQEKLKRGQAVEIRQQDVQTVQDVDDALQILLDKNRTNTQYLVDLCNHIAERGVVHTLDGIEIELYESAFVAERLRDFSFRRLFYDAFTEWNTRKNWVGLSRNARIMMTPLSSIEEFRQMFAVHKSVPLAALLRVCDMEGFNLLSQAEWLRVATFATHCESVESRDVRVLHRIVHQSLFVRLPFPTAESIREMAGRLDLSVTEEDIQSTFSSAV